MTINQFVGPYRFLSNFYPAMINIYGLQWTSAEHVYQAAKTTDLEYWRLIRSCQTAAEAKRLGRAVPMRADWDAIKVATMAEIVTAKFMQNPILMDMLLDTGNAQLIEGNNWNDTFWGVCNGRGENHLGRILMTIRNMSTKHG